jgi:dCTP deaminase
MAVLSDRDIRKRLAAPEVYYPSVVDKIARVVIEPCSESQVQPASIDLTLANEFMTYPSAPEVVGGLKSTYSIDLDHAKEVRPRRFVADQWQLEPHELVLCSTREYVEIPHDIQAQVHGKSSLGRIGLLVHVTAGFIDPGFKGNITLEMYNLNKRPIILRAGKPICQLSLMALSSPAEFPYGHEKLKSKYQDQRGVQASLYDG